VIDLATLIENLKKGNMPFYIEKIAADEKVRVEELTKGIVNGQIVVPSNNQLVKKKLVAIGKGLRTKVNANIGASPDFAEAAEELHKLEIVIEAGADTVMDLSIAGNLDLIRREILKRSTIPVGTVPIYQAAVEAREKAGSIINMTADEIFSVIEKQAADGVDFMTVHCGVTQEALQILRKRPRIANIVSRGGAIIASWMLYYDKENPLYEQFDRLLEISLKYDITLSLGDGMRPGCLADASDAAQFEELVTLGQLVSKSREAGVQVIVEGPGHLPLNEIEANVKLQKKICAGAPFYVLGPLVVDNAPGYDHIAGAIGGAIAAWSGADFLCYVTPREHLGLPDAIDVREGVIASRIAAHAADIAKGITGAADSDLQMAKARKELDWQKQLRLAIDQKKAKKAWKERIPAARGDCLPDGEGCSMCGDFCAMKLVSDFLKC
jgi:phosphomethylpyrimidine synthase